MFGQYILSASLLHNTFINTIYISDSKLFSMFGLAHKSTEVRENFADAYGRLREDIREHIQEVPDNKGLNSLICDHVIDVDLLIPTVAVNNPAVAVNNSANVVGEIPLLPMNGPANTVLNRPTLRSLVTIPFE
jgi:hypothetical protein